MQASPNRSWAHVMKYQFILMTLLVPMALAIAAGSYLCVTRFGVGTSSDSAVYLEAARSLIDKGQLSVRGRPLTHYPPAYPLLLAAVAGSIGLSVLDSARWVHLVLYLANLSVFAMIVFRISGRSSAFTILGVVLFASSRRLLEIHGMAWSEPPFLLCMLVGFLHMLLYVEEGRLSSLIVASASIAAALMTRYVGITLLPPAMLLVIMDRRQPLKSRLTRAGLLAVGVISPLAIWLIRNWLVASTSTNRQLGVHLISRKVLSEGIGTISYWVVPAHLPFILSAVIALAVICVVAFAFGSTILISRRETTSNFYLYFGLLFFEYLAFLIISISFIDPSTPLDERLLSPLHVFGLIAIVVTIREFVVRTSPIVWSRRTVTLYMLAVWLTLTIGIDTVKVGSMARKYSRRVGPMVTRIAVGMIQSL